MFDDVFNLTFTGEKNKTLARKALDKTGGSQNLRTTIIDSADGRTIIRNRNGFPLVMHEVKYVAPGTAVVKTGWNETDFTLREYADPVLTRLSVAMGGFYALVRPITSVDMDGEEGAFKLNPNVKIETNL